MMGIPCMERVSMLITEYPDTNMYLDQKRQDYVYGKWEYMSTWHKWEHYLRRENEAKIN